MAMPRSYLMKERSNQETRLLEARASFGALLRLDQIITIEMLSIRMARCLPENAKTLASYLRQLTREEREEIGFTLRKKSGGPVTVLTTRPRIQPNPRK